MRSTINVAGHPYSVRLTPCLLVDGKHRPFHIHQPDDEVIIASVEEPGLLARRAFEAGVLACMIELAPSPGTTGTDTSSIDATSAIAAQPVPLIPSSSTDDR